VTALEGALRRYDPATRGRLLSETLAREGRGFHMAFQLVLTEARDTIETLVSACRAACAIAPTVAAARFRRWSIDCRSIRRWQA